MLLSLKALTLDFKHSKFRSPVIRTENYFWDANNIMVAQCSKCRPEQTGTIGLDCTCGLYSSPNFQAIEEYDQGQWSVLLLLKLYGRTDIWWGPESISRSGYDLTQTRVCRSWGAKVVGIVERGEEAYKTNRELAAIAAAQILNVEQFSQKMVEIMIQRSWQNDEHAGFRP